MTTYADIDHDESDLSEYTGTTGDVRYQAVGGWSGTGSIFANADAGAAYGTKNLGVIADTAWYRARVNPAWGLAGTVLRGRNTGGDPTFEFALTDAGESGIGATLKVYTNAGSEIFTLTFPYEIFGAFWITIEITTGAAQGAAAAWINDAGSVEATTFGPNDNKKTLNLDVGITAGSANLRVNIDEIGARDEAIAAPGWTPVLVDTWQDGTSGTGPRTHEAWRVTGEPTGDWQEFTDKSAGFTTLLAAAIRGVRDVVEFRNPSGGVVYRAQADSGAAPDTDTIGRNLYPQIAPQVRFRNIGQIAAVRALIEFLT